MADAGLGKTALAAEVARRLNAVAFFANASRGLTRTDQCLNHLAVELIARFGLAHDHLPARAGEDSAFLGRVLAEAAAKVGGPLWLVVDALDESDPLGPGRNPLLLPDRLPRRVFMLVTHRPGDISIATDTGTANEEYRIASNDTTQQDDIAIYLRQVAERPEIRRAREATNPRITVDRFVSVLQQKSEGNFKYLDYVLADIAAREPGFDPLDLNALPSGLPGYYEQFWRQMEQVRDQEGWADWNGLYRPVIAFLAAAREPVPAAWLAAILGRPSEEIEERALRRWRRFLGQEGKGDSERWRVVHQSFADFLDGHRKVDLRAAHDRIAIFYLSSWGGLEAGLPGLHDLVKLDMDVRYGLRHLAAHLEAAGREDDLHHLMRLEWSDHQGEQTRARFENTWYTVHERVGDTSGYLSDVDRAWRLAEEAFADRRSSIRHRPSVPLCPDRHLSVQFGREYSSRAAGRASRKRHMAWSSRVGLRPTDPRTRTAYQGAGRAGPPPGADRAGPSPPRGAGGGAGHRGRGVPVRGGWPRWPPT